MSATPFDRQAVLANFGGDEALLAQIAAIAVEQWPQHQTRLAAARDARDLQALRVEAHAVKGSFATLAADAAVVAARELECAACAGSDAARVAALLENLLRAGDELVVVLRAEARA
jgi:HPt (histidine-containing phosphotransfer) domain-containing protein